MSQPSAAGCRLDPQPGEVIDRSGTLSFTWNGKPYQAHPGDTIISALAAAGERVFSRSFKYHRPRGLLTASFHDPGCMVQVGDEPNVRGAHRLAEPGMRVSAQNTWPSLRFDVKAVNQLAGRFLSAGFYYKTFMKPEFLWPAYQQVLRRFVHAGAISPDTPHGYYDQRYAHPDVLIAGGGPAGLAAAVAAAATGARVLLVEEEHQLGGHLRWADPAALAGLLAELRAAEGVEVLTNSAVLGRYDQNWIAVVQRGLPGIPERLIKARAGSLIVAGGLIERPYVFAGNDTPGRDAVHRGPPADQPVRGQAGRPCCRADRERRGRRRRRRPPAGRGRRGARGRRAAGRRCAAGARPQPGAGRRAEPRPPDHGRPVRHGHRMDGADRAAEHGGRCPGVRPARCAVPPRPDGRR